MKLPGFEGENLTEKLSRSSARSSAVSQGNREGGKSHALSNKPTLYRQGLHSASTPVYVSGFITAVQMIRNVFSERAFMVQVLPGVCTDQIHHTLSWHLKEKTTAMWSEIGVKLEAWNLIQNTAVRCHKWHTLSRNQWFKLMVCWQEGKKMFCLCPLHGKEIRNITFRCGEKKCFQCWNKTGDRMVKQVGEVL